jgi:excisionase family DNA binding protein
MGEDNTEGVQWLGVGEVARLCNVHRNTVHNWIKSGRLDAHKVVENDREMYRINAESLANVRPEAQGRNLDAQRPTDAQELAEVLGQRLQEIVQAHQQEMGDLREELGRERELRRQLEARLQEYEREAATGGQEAAENVSEVADRGEADRGEAAAEHAESHSASSDTGPGVRRPWWRRLLGR